MYPKMIYRGKSVPDQKAFEAALHSGAIEYCVVAHEEEEKRLADDGWTEDFASLIGNKRPVLSLKDKK